MQDCTNNPYLERAKQYCSTPEGITSLKLLVKRAEELSDLLEQSQIPTRESLTEPITI